MNFTTVLTKINNKFKYASYAKYGIQIKTRLNKDTLNRERDSMCTIILYSIQCVAAYMMNKACHYIILK